MADDLYKGVADHASALINNTLAKLTETHNAVALRTGEPPGRLFFPNGIELIYVRFKVGQTVDLTFAIGGEKAKYPAGASDVIASAENLALIGDEKSVEALDTPA